MERFKAQLQWDLFERGCKQSLGRFKLAGADQDFDQIKACIVVARVGGQSLFEFGLRGFQIARGNQFPSGLGFAFGNQRFFARDVFVQKRAQFAFGDRTHETVHRLAVFDQDAGGDAFDAKGRGQLLLLI